MYRRKVVVGIRDVPSEAHIVGQLKTEVTLPAVTTSGEHAACPEPPGHVTFTERAWRWQTTNVKYVTGPQPGRR